MALPVLCLGAHSRLASAQVAAGVEADVGTKTNVGVGARGIVELSALVDGLETVASFHWFFPRDIGGADITYWELNLNVVYGIRFEASLLVPYAGAGLNVAHFAASTHALGIDASGTETPAGLNLLGGVLADFGVVEPFIEAKGVLAGGDQFVVSVGVLARR